MSWNFLYLLKLALGLGPLLFYGQTPEDERGRQPAPAKGASAGDQKAGRADRQELAVVAAAVFSGFRHWMPDSMPGW